MISITTSNNVEKDLANASKALNAAGMEDAAEEMIARYISAPADMRASIIRDYVEVVSLPYYELEEEDSDCYELVEEAEKYDIATLSPVK